MGSTFSGLEIGKKSLWAQKKSLETTSHNISNANTEGYSRQEAIHTATDPLSVSGAGQMGTGVEVSKIRRMRNDFIDGQVRKENRTKGYWEVKEDSLDEIELIFNEPSDQGVEQTMSDFWNSMQELNNKPESKSVRATVRQRALAVTDTFNHIDTQLDDYQSSVDSRVETKVEDINSHANRIADLNEQIVGVEGGDQDANDLRDKRTKLVNELAKLTNIQYSENEEGALRVSISGRGLVQGDSVTELKAEPNSDDLYDVKWADGNDVTLKDGELKGLLEVRDEDLDT
ncbi:MAG: flagellar hook-associated protein FlgK, partial [Halanaerobacter sp.]